MNQITYFTPCNTVGAALAFPVRYPVFKAQTLTESNDIFNTGSALAKAVTGKHSRSYNYSGIYLFMALAAYVVIAIGNDVEVDMDLAMTSLVILLAVIHARVWHLQKCFNKPCA